MMNDRQDEILTRLDEILGLLKNISQISKPVAKDGAREQAPEEAPRCPENLKGAARQKWYTEVFYAPEMTYSECLHRLQHVWLGRARNGKDLAKTYKGVSESVALQKGKRECYWMHKYELAYYDDSKKKFKPVPLELEECQ